jgi:hypothetical protein
MPNVIKLLEQDHRKVEELFTQFEKTPEKSIALQICQEPALGGRPGLGSSGVPVLGV